MRRLWERVLSRDPFELLWVLLAVSVIVLAAVLIVVLVTLMFTPPSLR